MKILSILLFTTYIHSLDISTIFNENCVVNPETVHCVIPGKRNKDNDNVKCLGRNECPPCWKKVGREWHCFERYEINCNRLDIIDLDNYKVSCREYSTRNAETVLDLQYLVEDEMDRYRPPRSSRGKVLSIVNLNP